MLKTSELRKKTLEDLVALDRELSAELFQLRCELSVQRKLDQPHKLKSLRHDRARVLTVMTEITSR